MNFIYISPQFPTTNIYFCKKLKENGVNVLAIADEPYEALGEELTSSLTEYYKVSSLENYDEVLKAVAFFTFKYGKIDWIESNNEYWLQLDAKLRTDFNITSGIKNKEILNIKEKSKMKKFYKEAKIPVARHLLVNKKEEAVNFIKEVGYPVIVKPDNGVGSNNTFKISNDEQLKEFFDMNIEVQYIMEEYIVGDIESYDAIVNSKGEPLFESSIVFPPSIMDVVNEGLDISCYVRKEMPESLKEIGRRAVKSFNVRSRFVHMEFFKLLKDKKGIGKKGDYVGLEVNMRPSGGITPQMHNYARNTDVFQIWADMITHDEIKNANLNEDMENNFCVYVSRKDKYNYVYSHEDILTKFKDQIMISERLPELYSAAMGDYLYIAKFKTEQEKNDFVDYVIKK